MVTGGLQLAGQFLRARMTVTDRSERSTEVLHADADAVHLVGVRGADPAPPRADAPLAEQALGDPVQGPVVAAVGLDDVVDGAAELVSRLALALVTPLSPDEHECGHHLSQTVSVCPPQDEAPGAGARGSCTGRPADMGPTFVHPPEADADGRRSGGHLLVASARAGSTDEQEVMAAAELLGAELVTCTRPDDLERALDQLDGRTLVIAGGDGSLHLAVTKLHLRGELARTRIGLIALGSGNDLARGLDLPLDAVEAARVVRDGQARPMDLIVDDAGGVVVNAVHVGIGAEAAEHAGRLKPRLGPAAYPLGALRAGLRSAGWRLRVEVDGRVLSDSHRPTLMVGIGNGRGVGGGTPLLPLAEPDDGLLDVVVSKATSPFARVRFGAALASGQHLQDRDVRFARGHTVTLSGQPVGVNADGETGVEVRRRTWTVQPGAWSLVRP